MVLGLQKGLYGPDAALVQTQSKIVMISNGLAASASDDLN